MVGIDDVGSATDAVDWASAEAATRGCPLQIVHCFPRRPLAGFGAVLSGRRRPTAHAAAEAALGTALAHAHAVASDLEVTVGARPGSPTRRLLDVAVGARLLVLGSRTRTGLRGLLGHSMSARVAARARCPVVIVAGDRFGGDPRGSPPPRVVVGIGSPAGTAAAAGFAFQAARQRGIPLLAVRAWTPDPPVDPEVDPGRSTLPEVLAGRTLQRALQPWRAEFGEVAVQTALVRAAPEQALITRSRGAALLVVGARGGRQPRAALGPVSHAALQHAQSPVAVIGPNTVVTTASGGAPRDHHAGRDARPEHRHAPRNHRRSP